MPTNDSSGRFPPPGQCQTYRKCGPVDLVGVVLFFLLLHTVIANNPVFRTLEQAASVPVVYATAYYSLVVRGRLRPGETVLIHSGSGGVGQAAIAIALDMKCKVFTTVGK